MYMHIRTGQKVETVQTSKSRWMYKQMVAYLYHGILGSQKKEWSTDTCNNTDEPLNIMPRDRCQTQKVTYGTIPCTQTIKNK